MLRVSRGEEPMVNEKGTGKGGKKTSQRGKHGQRPRKSQPQGSQAEIQKQRGKRDERDGQK